jgi:hypothetical protein
VEAAGGWRAIVAAADILERGLLSLKWAAPVVVGTVSRSCQSELGWEPLIAVAELDEIAAARLEDARALLAARRYDGAIYLCGYAVEVGLKARTCRTLNWSAFPITSGEFSAYRSFQTHDLSVLLRLSGQEPRIKREHFELWNTLVAWRSDSRYTAIGSAKQREAVAMLAAAQAFLGVL